MIFEPWNVVKVPFPYIERPVFRHRPALVVAVTERNQMLVWLMMITSAENQHWPDDILLRDCSVAGLSASSLVRPVKIATVEARSCELIGKLAHMDCISVQKALDRILKPLRMSLAGAS